MASENKISYIIKKHIEIRGKNINQLSEAININPKTLYDKLQNNRLSVEDLFKISEALDIDLEWLKYALGYKKFNSSFYRVELKRMSKDYKKGEQIIVDRQIKRCMNDFAGNITDIRKEIIKTFDSIYYILDVLLPDDFQIYAISERGKDSYLVIPPQSQDNNLIKPSFIKGIDMLNEILFIKKEELKNENTIL